MPGEHYLEFRDFVTGARLGITTGSTGNRPTGVSSSEIFENGFRRITVRKVQNTPGSMDFDLPYNHPLLPLADKTLVIDWRRDVSRGIDWYKHLVGLTRDYAYSSSRGDRFVTVSAVGLKALLNWYIVAWPAGVTDRTSFAAQPAETIMKLLVARNCVTATATAAAGRDRNAPDYGISAVVTAGLGNSISWTANRSHSVLEELQAIALIGGGDFDLTYLTGTTRSFVWLPFISKTTTVKFSENLGNMDNIRFRRERSSEQTVAIVGGQGDTTDRDIVVRTGPNFASTNDIETFINATDIDKGLTAQLQARGDTKLQDLQSRDEFLFSVIQTEGLAYKRDYVEGDFVSAVRPDGVTVTQQIWGSTIDWKPASSETIQVEMRTR
jgi:hypothetical protein